MIDKIGSRIARHAGNAAIRLLGNYGNRALFAPRYGGYGVIFLMHRIIEENHTTLAPDLAIPVGALDRALRFVKESGWEIISMDELHARLANGWTGGRFACFTFDDGYADNYTLALPVFRKHSAPFCVYMSPEALDRSMTYWWGQLEDLLQRHDSIEVPIPSAEVIGRHLADSVRACVRRGVLRLDTERGDAGGPDRYILKRLTIETLAQKRAAYNLLQCIWHKQDSSEHSFRDMLQTVFEKYDSLRQALQDRDFINYEQARSLAADPLVTIGAHGMTHQRLSGLDREAMELELQQSRQRLEDSLAVPVRHISYPYGGADACGSREFDAARDLGFLTGVTTRSGNVLELDKEGAFCLPRRNLGWTIQDVNICLCGSMSFL